MKFHKIDKGDIYLRRAMWESYHKKCVYCGIALEVRHMHVDHILPTDEKKLINNNDHDLQKYLQTLQNNNFEKDSVENYLLSCSDCNIKKNNYSFSSANFRFYHEYAARHVSDILKRIQKCKGGIDKFDKTNEPPLERRKYDVSELFCEPQIINSIFQVTFRYGLGDIRIDAFLPVSYKEKMSCLISFKQLYQSNLFITYEENDIKKYLFSGYKTSIISGKSRWCTSYENLPSESVYEINLPNIKLQVSKEELNQMAVISDRLFEEYQLQMTTINNILGTTEFNKTPDNKFKLFSIRNDIFEILYNYIQNHQYDLPLTNNRNIFHLTANKNIFYLHQNLNSSDNAGIYACIHLEKLNGNYYDVLWSPGYSGNDYDNMLNFDNTIKWTAAYTYNRFLDDFIPNALNEVKPLKSLFEKLRSKSSDIIYNKQYLLEHLLVKSYKNE